MNHKNHQKTSTFYPQCVGNAWRRVSCGKCGLPSFQTAALQQQAFKNHSTAGNKVWIYLNQYWNFLTRRMSALKQGGQKIHKLTFSQNRFLIKKEEKKNHVIPVEGPFNALLRLHH